MADQESQLDAIVLAILNIYADIEGIDDVLDYEPFPLYPRDKVVVFPALDDLTVPDQEAAGGMTNIWKVPFRLVIPFTRNGSPETLLRHLVARIRYAHGKAITAHGAIANGTQLITAARPHHITKGGGSTSNQVGLYRCLDVEHTITETFTFQYEA